MIALHAAGGGPPLAVHLPHLVEQIGALAGFAAVAGLAILSALYFSQARDLKRLREWAGRAPERAAESAAAPVGDKAPGKPGMPAPASAAAAAGAGAAMAASAGAGAASAAGPAAPAAAPGGAAPVGTPAEAPGGAPAGAPGGPAAKPAPQRPPTSVLPPRTGAVPPVRRIGGTAAGNPALRQSGILDPSAPERPKRNPVYIALAVVGVLVLGAGAAIGVPKLVNGGSSSKSTKKPAAARHVTKPAALRPSDITV